MDKAEKSTWIKNPLKVWTGNQLGSRHSADGGIVVSGDRIVELVPQGATPTRNIHNTLDASGCVVMPGLINCHHHFYQTLTRAFPSALNKELFDWLVSLYPVWANLTEEAISISSELALTEMLLSGCTTAADHHYVFSDKTQNAIDRQVEAAEKVGMRVLLRLPGHHQAGFLALPGPPSWFALAFIWLIYGRLLKIKIFLSDYLLFNGFLTCHGILHSFIFIKLLQGLPL